MASADHRRRGRLDVVVAAPDGAAPAARGLGGWLARTAPSTARGEVSVAVISDNRMRCLNRAYRGRDYATDVLSFPVRTSAAGSPTRALRAGAFLGDIVIAAGVAAGQAREAGHPLRTEIRVLALHGLLHLLGYDHETDTGQMDRVEARLRRKGGVPEVLPDGSGQVDSVRARTRRHATRGTRRAR
jgi:probable rRNA maturation factor